MGRGLKERAFACLDDGECRVLEEEDLGVGERISTLLPPPIVSELVQLYCSNTFILSTLINLAVF